MNRFIYARIKDLCYQSGITIARLEKTLGFSNGTISKWGNQVSPSAEKIEKVADYFNVSTDYIYGKTEIKTPIDEMLDNDIINIQRTLQKFDEEERIRHMQMIKICLGKAFDEE